MAISFCLSCWINFLYNFFIKYVLIIFFPFYNSFQTLCQPPQPSSFMFALSHLKQSEEKMKIKINKLESTKSQQCKRKRQKTMKDIQKKNKTVMESILCWSNTPLQGIYHGVWWIFSVTLYWRKLIFPFLEGTYKLPTVSELGVRLSVTFLLHDGTSSGLNLW